MACPCFLSHVILGDTVDQTLGGRGEGRGGGGGGGVGDVPLLFVHVSKGSS